MKTALGWESFAESFNQGNKAAFDSSSASGSTRQDGGFDSIEDRYRHVRFKVALFSLFPANRPRSVAGDRI
ncbi:hypothetical protein [Novipirellula rosea]|uniref:Uncharacterized protein n=1 Tax=Novipirellula rosea TaxID=1031540 RepID=A0ABP8N7C6_9BACT